MESSLTNAAVPPLFSPEFQRDPYPTYQKCLRGAALQPSGLRPNVWLLFHYEACTRVIRDERLSAKRAASQLVSVGDDAQTEFEYLVAHMQRWLLLRDAPQHTVLRKILNGGFTPTAIHGLATQVESIINRLLDRIADRASFDLIKEFAYPLPVRVICALLGLPDEFHDRCVDLTNDIALWLGDLRRPPDLARNAQRAVHELTGYFAEIIHLRRGVRKNDLLGLLMDAAAEAEVMTEAEIHAQCIMLLFAGHETTRNLIGNGLFTLLKHRDAWNELRSEEKLLPAAVEELLRYESPLQGFMRIAKTELEVEGVSLPAGSAIMFMIGAAHRDPRQYREPDRLNLRRVHNRHLAFGCDAHVCLGSTLARLEARLSIGALIRRYATLQLADGEPDWGRNFGFRGLSTLRVHT
jgi:cytochrome P450